MKKLIIATLAASVIGVVPASASAATTSYCDTDAKTFYVTKGGKRKIKVKIEARGCIEHTVTDGFMVDSDVLPEPKVTCSVVTVVQSWKKPPSVVDFLDDNVKTELRWAKRGTQLNPWQCSALDNSNFYQIDKRSGKYTYRTGLTKYCAFPTLMINVHGEQQDLVVAPENIVQIWKSSGWTFSKCKKNGRNRQLPPAVALPIPNGGSSPMPNGDGGDGGMRGGDSTNGPQPPTADNDGRVLDPRNGR